MFHLAAKAMFQHTAARRRLQTVLERVKMYVEFQHTAARRRLLYLHIAHAVSQGFNTQPPEGGCRKIKTASAPYRVSTHSRPKAAV